MNNPRWGRIVISVAAYLSFLVYLMRDPDSSILATLSLIAFMAFFAFIALLILGILIVFSALLARPLLRFWGLDDTADSIDGFLGPGGLGIVPVLIALILVAFPVAIILNNPYRFPILYDIIAGIINLK